jgi:hypothetical protein
MSGLLVEKSPIVNIDSDRVSVLQFLPKKISHLKDDKFIVFNNKKIKTSYIIDIVHNLIMKYYFKGENRFPLSSLILKEKYGYLYNYYIKYLLENKIIILQKEYLKGRNSKVYSLSNDIISEDIFRFRNCDKIVLKKWKNKLDINRNTSLSPIIQEVREKLIQDLYSVNLDYSRSLFFLQSIKDTSDSYNRNLYSTESIRDGNIFYHFDKYGRLHTNFTILKSTIRKNFLTIDGEETAEIDIKNSQPFFLSNLISIINTKWVKKDEFILFKKLVDSGDLYDFIEKNLGMGDRSDAKDLMYRVLFGQNRKGSPSDEKFKSIFPTIHNFIRLYKKENCDYRILSHHLQKMESDLIFNKVIFRIMKSHPHIKVVTIHDSIITIKKYKDIVEGILLDEICKI